MINVKDANVTKVMQEVHEAMLRTVKRAGRQEKEDFILENRLYAIICNDIEFGPRKCAAALAEKYGYDLDEDDVIRILKDRRMGNPVERKELYRWAEEVADLYAQAIQGKKDSFEKYEKKRKEPIFRNGKRHSSQEKLVAIMIFEKYPELDVYHDRENLLKLGNTMAKYFFYDMSDAVAEVYGFPQYRDNKKKDQPVKAESKLTAEQLEKKLQKLEDQLDRTNALLEELQEEFAEQLAAAKLKELTDFFAKLNSEKYGCILDELLSVRKGVDDLRKNGFELPIEINGLLIMIKKLIQFVRDNHIEPMMKVNSVKSVTAADVEFCNYEGSPFSSPEDTKEVRVVSPGWIYKDKEVQISRPKVKEEE